MKILLILAHTGSKSNIFRSVIYTSIYPSLTIEQLAASTTNSHEITLIDERYQNIDFNWDGDIVGISCLTYSAPHAYAIADIFRERGINVVLGGYHPSALPNEAKQHADSVVIGEAEISWPLLIKDFEKGILKPFYKSKKVAANKIPKPIRIKKKVITSSIQATRGCPYNCKFCSVYTVEGCALRMRPIEEIIEEIKSIKSRGLFFADNSLTINPKYTKSLFKAMKGLDKKFSCYGNVNSLAKDDELLSLSKDAGCNLWIAGFESINQKTLKDIGKKTNIIKDYSSAVKKIKDHGMMISGLFMFGFDTDKPDIFNKTYDAVNKWELDRAGFAILTPFPGTKMYNILEKKGRILTKDWAKYNLKHVVFEPKNMSPKELLEGTNRLVKEFYSIPNSLRRNFRYKNKNFYQFFNKILDDYMIKKSYDIIGY